MHPQQHVSWFQLALSGSALFAEASMVIWLRSLRLMRGGRDGEREAERMITEKFAAHLGFASALMAEGGAQRPLALTAIAIDHYRKPVQDNLRRLSRP